MNGALARLIAEELETPAAPVVVTCAAHFAAHFGPSTAAVLFYGAGLRAPEPETVLDFYVVTDDLRMLPAVSRLAARILPPNVYAFVVPLEGRMQLCKVAVLTMRDFTRGMRAFASPLWARFAQPVSLPYRRDKASTAQVIDALTIAIDTTANATLPLMPASFSSDDLWRRAFAETYAAELRPESQARANALVTARYDAITAAVLDMPRRRQHPLRARLGWVVRRWWGKLLNALRLMKAAFTYADGLDYAVAKIARHSGVCVAVTDADRRRPLLGGIRIFLEARRRGGVR